MDTCAWARGNGQLILVLNYLCKTIIFLLSIFTFELRSQKTKKNNSDLSCTCEWNHRQYSFSFPFVPNRYMEYYNYSKSYITIKKTSPWIVERCNHIVLARIKNFLLLLCVLNTVKLIFALKLIEKNEMIWVIVFFHWSNSECHSFDVHGFIKQKSGVVSNRTLVDTIARKNAKTNILLPAIYIHSCQSETINNRKETNSIKIESKPFKIHLVNSVMTWPTMAQPHYLFIYIYTYI